MVKKRTKNNFFSKRRYSRKKYPKRKSKRRKSRKRYSKRRYSKKNKQKGGGTYWCIILYTLPIGTKKGDNFKINYKITGVGGTEINGSSDYIAEKDYPNGKSLSSVNKFIHIQLRDVVEGNAEEIYGKVKKMSNTSVDSERSTTPERPERTGGARPATPPF